MVTWALKWSTVVTATVVAGKLFHLLMVLVKIDLLSVGGGAVQCLEGVGCCMT